MVKIHNAFPKPLYIILELKTEYVSLYFTSTFKLNNENGGTFFLSILSTIPLAAFHYWGHRNVAQQIPAPLLAQILIGPRQTIASQVFTRPE